MRKSFALFISLLVTAVLATWLAAMGGSLLLMGAGGPATIVGSIADTQVAFGTGVNTIGGDANLTWDNTAKRLTVAKQAALSTNGFLLVGDADASFSAASQQFFPKTALEANAHIDAWGQTAVFGFCYDDHSTLWTGGGGGGIFFHGAGNGIGCSAVGGSSLLEDSNGSGNVSYGASFLGGLIGSNVAGDATVGALVQAGIGNGDTSGAAEAMIGLYAAPNYISKGGGNATVAYNAGVQIGDQSGIATANYGLYISNQATVGTGNYAIYSSGGRINLSTSYLNISQSVLSTDVGIVSVGNNSTSVPDLSTNTGQYGALFRPTLQMTGTMIGGTPEHVALYAVPYTLSDGGASRTIARQIGLKVDNGYIGAGATVTDKYGIYVVAPTGGGSQTGIYDGGTLHVIGAVTIDDLKTAGAATGKKVVCADTNGKLYVSTSDVQCLN